MVIVAFFVLAAILAPVTTPHSPLAISSEANIPPYWQKGGTLSNPLGTDRLGRDVWSRLVYGARSSLVVAAGALAVGGLLETAFGFFSGYWRGSRDRILDSHTSPGCQPGSLVAVLRVDRHCPSCFQRAGLDQPDYRSRAGNIAPIHQARSSRSDAPIVAVLVRGDTGHAKRCPHSVHQSVRHIAGGILVANSLPDNSGIPPHISGARCSASNVIVGKYDCGDAQRSDQLVDMGAASILYPLHGGRLLYTGALHTGPPQ